MVIKISVVQRQKLTELVCHVSGVTTEHEGLTLLEGMFQKAFGHPLSEGTYEEGARLTAKLLAEKQMSAATKAAQTTQPPPAKDDFWKVEYGSPPAQSVAHPADGGLGHRGTAPAPKTPEPKSPGLRWLEDEEAEAEVKTEAGAQVEEAKRHWIDDSRERTKFWSTVRKLKVMGVQITEKHVHEFLGLAHMRDYKGTREEAEQKVMEEVDRNRKLLDGLPKGG